MASLSQELARSASVKEELLRELARMQARQRDTVAQIEAADDQLKRLETIVKQIEQRQAQIALHRKEDLPRSKDASTIWRISPITLTSKSTPSRAGRRSSAL